MGTLRFQLPDDLNAPALGELEHSCILGGQDHMPFLTEVSLDPEQMLVSRQDDESGSVAVPWRIDGAGVLLTSTATLIERRQPYGLVLELARGKLNQLRNQAADWVFGGLHAAPELNRAISEAARVFVRAVAAAPDKESVTFAQTALERAHIVAGDLVDAYVRQVFDIRHQRQAAFETTMGVRIGPNLPSDALAKELHDAFNAISLPIAWAQVESVQGQLDWSFTDQLLDWAIANGYQVSAGPLLDFRPSGLPSWISAGHRDLASIAGYARGFVERAVKRYKGRIRTWQLTSGANCSDLLGLGEEELLWLIVRLADAARQVEPTTEIVIGLAQPWGDYLAHSPRINSPFVFADTLIRSGLNPSAIDLEMVLGVSPRGSYCRDLLETSRIIDLYSLLGVPLQITLGIPSSAARDPLADPDLVVRLGSWRGGYTPEIQGEWATEFGKLAVCKPAVRSVVWTHLSDDQIHLFPWCGLVGIDGQPKPALRQLAHLREAHLR